MSKYSIQLTKIQEEKLPKNIRWKYIKAIHQGNIVDVTKMTNKPECHILNVSKQKYKVGYYDKDRNFVCVDGILRTKRNKQKEGKHMRNRRSLKIIFRDLRQLITTNFQGGSNEVFLTLTYAIQTNDHKQIHQDYKKFWMRLKRAYKDYDLAYIAIVEPHASGKYHIHVLLKSLSKTSLFMPVEDVAKIWGLGRIQMERIKSDNMGAYFVAYFSNMEIPSDEVDEYARHNDIEEKNGKKYIKGMRLDFYPDNMLIYRYSKNITKPEVKNNISLPANYKRTYQNITRVSDKEDIAVNAYTVIEQYKTLTSDKNDIADTSIKPNDYKS